MAFSTFIERLLLVHTCLLFAALVTASVLNFRNSLFRHSYYCLMKASRQGGKRDKFDKGLSPHTAMPSAIGISLSHCFLIFLSAFILSSSPCKYVVKSFTIFLYFSGSFSLI